MCPLTKFEADYNRYMMLKVTHSVGWKSQQLQHSWNEKFCGSAWDCISWIAVISHSSWYDNCDMWYISQL